MEGCPHLNFDARVNVGRIHKSEADPDIIVAYQADIEVKCHDCGQAFAFFGVPHGFSFYQPTVGLSGLTLSVPLVIPGTEPPPGLAGFRVTQTEFPAKEGPTQ